MTIGKRFLHNQSYLSYLNLWCVFCSLIFGQQNTLKVWKIKTTSY